MTLLLEVEYLLGVSFAAIGPDNPTPDWPPQPDRIFSALVATWAARGQDRLEADALEWLEGLPAPCILASDAEPRTARTVYVPPNDYQTPGGELSKLKWYRDYLSRGVTPPEKGGYKKGWLDAWHVMPDQRRRSGLKERHLPAARPHDPIVRYSWAGVETDERTLTALERLARDIAYVGHSASLTRCRFVRHENHLDLSAGRAPHRWVYGGRFSELRDAYAAFERSGGKQGRPLPGVRVHPPIVNAEQPHGGLFSRRWLVFEHVTGEMPDVRACAVVGKVLRDAILAGYQRIGLGDRIPEVVSGHTPEGAQARVPHIAIVPLTFSGFHHADGHVVGFAIIPPRDSAILADETFLRACRRLAPIDEERGRRILTLRTKEGTPSDRAFSIDLSPTLEAGRRSLDPALYVRPALTFATVTPIVLDRHLKEEGEARDEEAKAQVAAACGHIGLPMPVEVVVDKHSAVAGAPSAYPSARSPAWTRWRLPQALASRQLTHAVIRFGLPVEGPVLLGAGRFMGLGLCRPLDSEEP